MSDKPVANATTTAVKPVVQQQQQRPLREHPQKQGGEKVGTILILPDGKRIVLDHVASYAPGGDCGIHFTIGAGAPVAWTCPHGWRIKGHFQGASQEQRQEAVDDVLDQIDSFFRSRDLREHTGFDV